MKTAIVLLLVALLSSCAETPLTVGIQGQYGNYSYSAKRGIEVHINATK